MSEQKKDDRWIRDIRLAHVHGMLVGFKKNLSYEEFSKKWMIICACANEDGTKVNEGDKEIFDIVNKLHMNILDNALDLAKDQDLDDVTKLELVEMAKIISDFETDGRLKIKNE